MMAIRIDHVESIYQVGEMLAAEESDLRLSLVTTDYAEKCREWSVPVRFRIVDDRTHRGVVIVEVQNA